jgi:hypothetical protein
MLLLLSKKNSVHLFFECVVSKAIWSYVCEFLGFSIEDYMSVASKWLTRNDFNFHKQDYLDVKIILKRMLRLTMEYLSRN